MSWFIREAYNHYLEAQVEQATDPKVKRQLEAMLADSQQAPEFAYFQMLAAASRIQAEQAEQVEQPEQPELAGATEDEYGDEYKWLR